MTFYNINPGYLKENQTYQLSSLTPNTASSLPKITNVELTAITGYGNISKRAIKKMVYGTPNGQYSTKPKAKCTPSQPTPFTAQDAHNFSLELNFARPFFTRCANIMSRTVVEADVKIDKKRKLVVFFSDIPATIIGADRTVAGHKIPETLKATPSYKCFISRMIAGGVFPEVIWLKCVAKQNVDHCLDIIMPTMYHIMRKLDNIMKRPENASACGINPMYLKEEEWTTSKGIHLAKIKSEWFSYAQGIWANELPKILLQLDEVPQGEEHLPYVVKDETEVEWSRITSTIQGRLNDSTRSKTVDINENVQLEMALYQKSVQLKAMAEKKERAVPPLPKEKDMPHLLDRLCPTSNPIRPVPETSFVPPPPPPPPPPIPLTFPSEQIDAFCRPGPVYNPGPPESNFFPPKNIIRLNSNDRLSPTAYYYQKPREDRRYFDGYRRPPHKERRPPPPPYGPQYYRPEYPLDYGSQYPNHYDSTHYPSTSNYHQPPSHDYPALPCESLPLGCTCSRRLGISRLPSGRGVRLCRVCRMNQPCPIVAFDDESERKNGIEFAKISKPNPIIMNNSIPMTQTPYPIIDLTPSEATWRKSNMVAFR